MTDRLKMALTLLTDYRFNLCYWQIEDCNRVTDRLKNAITWLLDWLINEWSILQLQID